MGCIYGEYSGYYSLASSTGSAYGAGTVVNSNVTSYCANQYPNGNICGSYYYKRTS